MKEKFSVAKVLLVPIAAMVLSSNNVSAWNDRGHMMVAAVAWEQLNPASKARAAELLKLNPLFNGFVQGAPANDRDKFAFVTAATWPDIIKRANAGFTNDGEVPLGPDAARNIGYADKLQHRYWHFVDLPFSTDGTPLVQPNSPNAETQIVAFRDTLTSQTASDDVKSYDMVWLLHLVGDVHQPLHATSRFSKDLSKGDRGGNLVALCMMPCRDELHAFWDEAVGTDPSVSAAITAAAKLPPAPPSGISVSDAHAWIVESFTIAKDSVYVSPIGEGLGPFTVSGDYRQAARTIAEERISLAGARLANLLNGALR